MLVPEEPTLIPPISSVVAVLSLMVPEEIISPLLG
jgi:hypothetical protein